MYKNNLHGNITGLWGRIPDAVAVLNGVSDAPSVRGKVWFYKTHVGTLAVANISGLAYEGKLELHVGREDGGDYIRHLLSSDCCVFSSFLVNRLEIEDIVGKSVVIYSAADTKIACGEIRG